MSHQKFKDLDGECRNESRLERTSSVPHHSLPNFVFVLAMAQSLRRTLVLFAIGMCLWQKLRHATTF